MLSRIQQLSCSSSSNSSSFMVLPSSLSFGPSARSPALFPAKNSLLISGSFFAKAAAKSSTTSIHCLVTVTCMIGASTCLPVFGNCGFVTCLLAASALAPTLPASLFPLSMVLGTHACCAYSCQPELTCYSLVALARAKL